MGALEACRRLGNPRQSFASAGRLPGRTPPAGQPSLAPLADNHHLWCSRTPLSLVDTSSLVDTHRPPLWTPIVLRGHPSSSPIIAPPSGHPSPSAGPCPDIGAWPSTHTRLGPLATSWGVKIARIASPHADTRADRKRPQWLSMARPRSELVDRENGGFYHLYNRCVRQAWLCGKDPHTGENFDHRREWIEQRLLILTTVFPVDVYAYAVMSNHYHIVVHYCPARAQEWSDAEIVRRWLCVFGPPPRDPLDRAAKEAALLANPARLAEIRQCLGDLSWYMRCLNEHIARRANREEDRTGRFWDGRFESRPLADVQAAHACMVYNDLNPLRAGMVEQIDAPQQTSLRRRLEEAETAPKRMQESLRPLRIEHGTGRVVSSGESALSTTLEEYLSQAEWTAARCRGEYAGTDPPLYWRGRRTWLTTFIAQRRRTQRRSETPAWLAAIT